MLEFRKFTDFPRGTIYNILQDAYSYDARNKEIWKDSWKESDDFFYDNPEIAEKYGLVTCIDGEPIGFITWDPRKRPDYVEIGYNGIRNRSGLFCTTESLMKRKVPIQVIICIMRSCFDFDNGRKNNLFSYKFKNRQ